MSSPKLLQLHLAEAGAIEDAAIRAEVERILTCAARAAELVKGAPGTRDDAFASFVVMELADAPDTVGHEIDKAFALITTSVLDYFAALLGESSTLVADIAECPLDSACGADCRRAIDGAYILLDCMRSAYGEGDRMEAVREMAAQVCNCFWRG